MIVMKTKLVQIILPWTFLNPKSYKFLEIKSWNDSDSDIFI
jgi:hypothetical protein